MTAPRPLTDAELTDVLASVADEAVLPVAALDEVRQATRTIEQQRQGWLGRPRLADNLVSRVATFALAGIIVLAFGSLLAVGLLDRDVSGEVVPASAPSSSTPEMSITPDGLTLTEVRPGIWRVLDDGIGHPTTDARQVEVAPDGTVWVATDTGIVFALGGAGDFDHEDDGFPRDVRGFEALADGTLAAYDERWLATTIDHGAPDGQEWIDDYDLDGLRIDGIHDVLRTSDGALWVAMTGHDGSAVYQLARVSDGERTLFSWDDMGLPPDGWAISRIAETNDGSIWAAQMSMTPEGPGLVRYVGGEWQTADPFGDGQPYGAGELAVDGVGVLWASLWSDVGPDGYWRGIGRWDGEGWATEHGRSGVGAHGPDGVQWSYPELQSWDGQAETHYAFPGPFSDTDVSDLAFTPDGRAWLVMTKQEVTPVLPGAPEPGLYVMDPATAAASIPVRRVIGDEDGIPVPLPEFGNDVVVELFAVGNTWYAQFDSIGPTGDRVLGTDRGAENPVGAGADPREAIESALLHLGADLARRAAEAVDMDEWSD